MAVNYATTLKTTRMTAVRDAIDGGAGAGTSQRLPVSSCGRVGAGGCGSRGVFLSCACLDQPIHRLLAMMPAFDLR